MEIRDTTDTVGADPRLPYRDLRRRRAGQLDLHRFLSDNGLVGCEFSGLIRSAGRQEPYEQQEGDRGVRVQWADT